jgi:hypothetical protein
MFQYAQYLVILGALAQLIGIYSYIKDTVQGKTKPNRISWLLWSIAPMIGTVAAISKGVTWAALPVFMSGFAPFLVLIASFFNKKSYWKLEKLDYLCGISSALALVLWAITKEPIVAIVFAIISDALACIPTIIKSWKYPETETVAAYTTGLFNTLTSFAAIQSWNFSSIAYPAYLLIANLVIIIAIVGRRENLRKVKIS